MHYNLLWYISDDLPSISLYLEFERDPNCTASECIRTCFSDIINQHGLNKSEMKVLMFRSDSTSKKLDMDARIQTFQKLMHMHEAFEHSVPSRRPLPVYESKAFV